MFLFMVPFVFFGILKAQVSVSGVVTDESTSEKLIGVTILEIGTTNGMVTDDNGRYSISLLSDTASLQFFYVGFKTQIIKVGNQVV